MIKKFFSMLSFIVVMAFAVTSVTMTSCVESGSEIDNPEVKEGDYVVVGTKEVKSADGKVVADAVIVQYISVAPDMKTLIPMSGIISLPKNPKDLKGIVLDNHYTITSDAECPSMAGGTDAGKMVASDFCVVSADYIGYGLTSNLRHPYLHHEVSARNSIVLAQIAVSILKASDIRGLKLFNTGYSQGGAVALAVHREMEKNPALAKELGFAGTWCGDGPYDVEATTKFYLANSDNVSYPVALPLLVEGFLASAPVSLRGDLKFTDFFTDAMNKAGLEASMRERKLTTTEINKKMQDAVGGTTLKVSDIFSAEMAVESGSLMQTYLKFAGMNNLTQYWTPTNYPLRLIHWIDDDVVPVVNAQNAQRGLDLDSDAVTYVPTIMFEQQLAELGINAPASHGDFGLVFYGLTLIEIAAALAAQ